MCSHGDGIGHGGTSDTQRAKDRAEAVCDEADLRKALIAAVKPLATKAELREAIAEVLSSLTSTAEFVEAMRLLATRSELAEAADAIRVKLADVTQRLATKDELELWGGALTSRSDRERAEESARLRREFREDLRAELAQHVRAFGEFTQSLIASLDDRYKDLPPRFGALESAVFGDEPR